MPGDPAWPETIDIPEATEQFLSPDTTTTKRVDFTDFFLRFRHAPDAHSAYKHIFIAHQKLIKLLAEHPAMEPNLQQTFSTPAKSKNKVYFMWDFVLRTFQFLAAQVNPREPHSSPMFSDVVGRSSQAKMLTVDEEGQMESMNAAVGNSDDGGVEFTDEIKEVAGSLLEFPDGCAGCGKDKKDDGKALLVCSRCKGEMYCSTECQKKCWKKHKKECEPAQEAS